MHIHRHSLQIAGILSGALLVLGLGALLLFPAGCSLVSGTLRISHDFEEGPQHSTGTDVKELMVDLNQESDFKDNKDKIKSVDEVGFVFRAQNNRGDRATGEIYISATRISPLTATQIRASCTRVLTGLVLNPGYTDVTYDQSLALEENQKVLHKLVKEGTFYLYGIASESDFDITIDKLTAVLVLTFEI